MSNSHVSWHEFYGRFSRVSPTGGAGGAHRVGVLHGLHDGEVGRFVIRLYNVGKLSYFWFCGHKIEFHHYGLGADQPGVYFYDEDVAQPQRKFLRMIDSFSLVRLTLTGRNGEWPESVCIEVFDGYFNLVAKKTFAGTDAPKDASLWPVSLALLSCDVQLSLEKYQPIALRTKADVQANSRPEREVNGPSGLSGGADKFKAPLSLDDDNNLVVWANLAANEAAQIYVDARRGLAYVRTILTALPFEFDTKPTVVVDIPKYHPNPNFGYQLDSLLTEFLDDKDVDLKYEWEASDARASSLAKFAPVLIQGKQPTSTLEISKREKVVDLLPKIDVNNGNTVTATDSGSGDESDRNECVVLSDAVESSSASKLAKLPHELWDVRTLHKELKADGDCVRVALLDSGIDVAHPMLRHCVAGFKSVVDGENGWTDSNGHGTHCASTIATVAPGCRLYSVKCLKSDRRRSTVDALVSAINFATNEIKADVISISVGSTAYDERLDSAIGEAVLKGVVVVCSAANAGQRRQSNIEYPAAFGNVLCVGSHDRQGQVSRFSSAGREIDFLCPGEDVSGASAGDIDLRVLSGTSMATPFAVGLIAVLREYCLVNLGVKLTTQLARVLLRKMCTSPGAHSPDRGYGVLNPVSELVLHGSGFIDRVLKHACLSTPIGALQQLPHRLKDFDEYRHWFHTRKRKDGLYSILKKKFGPADSVTSEDEKSIFAEFVKEKLDDSLKAIEKKCTEKYLCTLGRQQQLLLKLKNDVEKYLNHERSRNDQSLDVVRDKCERAREKILSFKFDTSESETEEESSNEE